tara:strand:+ start:676 stop:2397 length:1722 start_codon:yes stop_codon:yes gene_type:complete
MSSFSLEQNLEESNLDFINTQVLRPISINNDSCTIIIPNRGGSLDKKTCILLPATVSNNNCFYPIGTGVAALLSSVSLLANGKVICQNTEPGQYLTMSSYFQKQEYRRRVLTPRMGIRENYSITDTGTQTILNGSAAQVLQAPGKIALSQIERLYETPNIGAWQPAVNSFGNVDESNQGLNNYCLSTDEEKTGQFYLYLHELFPKLYGTLELPTYLIDDELSLVIRFSNNSPTPQANERVLCDSDNIQRLRIAAPTGIQIPYVVSCQILTDQVVLLTDYLVPTQKAKMELTEKVMSNEGLVLTYGDLLTNNFFMQGLADVPVVRNFKRYNFSLGMSNKTIRQMYIMFNPTKNYTLTNGDTPYAPSAGSGADGTPDATTRTSFSPYNSINCLKGKYASKALSYLEDGERVQIQFNSQNLYNTPLQSSGEKLHQLMTAYGSQFCMPSSCYDFKDITIDSVDGKLPAYADHVGRLLYQKSLISNKDSIQGWSNQNTVGNAHVLGFNLQRPVLTENNRLVRVNIAGSGRKCGTLPIQIQIDRLQNRSEPNDDRDMVVICCVEKTMTLQGGQVYVNEE